MIITAYINGEPKAQPRPRAFARGGTARVYDPGTAEGWKSSIAVEMQEHAGKELDGPLSVSMTFYFKRPKSHFGTGRNAELLKASSPHHHLKKPDGDNLAKAVADALTAIGVWGDDSQIVRWAIGKEWADDTPHGMSLMIRQMGEDE